MANLLSAKAVGSLKPDPSKRLEIGDAAVPGLYLIINPSGARSWALRYRFHGKPRKLTLGPVLVKREGDGPAGPPLGAALTLPEARNAGPCGPSGARRRERPRRGKEGGCSAPQADGRGPFRAGSRSCAGRRLH